MRHQKEIDFPGITGVVLLPPDVRGNDGHLRSRSLTLLVGKRELWRVVSSHGLDWSGHE